MKDERHLSVYKDHGMIFLTDASWVCYREVQGNKRSFACMGH